MQNYPLLTVTGLFPAAAIKYRIAIETATDGQYAQASTATQRLAGVINSRSIDAGKYGEVVKAGITPVEYGGTVAAGDSLTADASGRGVKAITANNVIGIAQEAGTVGVIGSVLIAPVLVLPSS